MDVPRAQFGRKASAGARMHRVHTEPDLVQNVCLYISNFVTNNNDIAAIFKRILKMLMDYCEDPARSCQHFCKIVLEYTLKCSQLISSSDNKKILLTTRNVRLYLGRYATKYY